jgi:hypothetical protein
MNRVAKIGDIVHYYEGYEAGKGLELAPGIVTALRSEDGRDLALYVFRPNGSAGPKSATYAEKADQRTWCWPE